MISYKECSFRVNGVHCQIPPSYILSISVNEEEYMICVICESHKSIITAKIQSLQTEGVIPQGIINLQSIKLVNTNCIKGWKAVWMEQDQKIFDLIW